MFILVLLFLPFGRASPKNGHSFQCAKIIIILVYTNKIEKISTRASGKIFKYARIMMHIPRDYNDPKPTLPKAQWKMLFYKQESSIFKLDIGIIYNLFLPDIYLEKPYYET